MAVSGKTHLLYLFKGKLEIEDVPWYEGYHRMRAIQGCTQADVYRLAPDGTLCEYFGNYWRTAKNVPEEIKLAAMLL